MRTVYLVRHAIAEERGGDWPTDALRPLTPHGVERMRAGVSGLRAMGVVFDAVLTSPLVRARQTAELLIAGLKPAPRFAESLALAPAQPPQSIARGIDADRRWTSIALVGHEPGLGQLAAWCLGASAPLVFKKGGVCRIDFSGRVRAGAGQLQWLALPKMLRAMGA